jgi:hypothetical protein
MKKIDLNINQNYFTKKANNFTSKKLIQNPKKILKKKRIGAKSNYTSLYLNQSSPYYNLTNNPFIIPKDYSNQELRTDKTCASIKTNYTKVNFYRAKMRSARPKSSSIKKLPILYGNNNSSMNYNPNSFIMNIEEERLNQEKNQLNKMIKYLNQQLNQLKKENEEKDILLNHKEKQLKNLIYSNDLTEEEKDLYNIMVENPTNINKIEESKSLANNASYNLIFKIKKEINNVNAKIMEENEKIEKLKSSLIYTKLKEINIENNFIESQINKIASFLNNSLNIKEVNDIKMEEIENFEYNINVQNQIMEELENKKKMLNQEELILKNSIKNIGTDVEQMKKQVEKNTKELDVLRQRNKNLLKDKVINSKIIIREEMTSQTLASYYNSKINQLKKDIHFYKSKLSHDEMIKSKIKEQKTNMIESLKQMKNNNNNLPSKLSVLKINIENQIREEQKSQINNETIEEPKNILDEEKIEKLKKIYAKGRNYERKLENKYKEIFEKFKELYNIYQEQNKTQRTNDEKNQDENNTNNNDENQNEIEFGIDRNNPFYTEDENNNPEIDLKFNSTQYNQFTYILFKNFESQGIVGKESYTKIINPFVDFVNGKKLKSVKYPSDEFNLVIENFTKIILDTINSSNKSNNILTKTFLSAMLINSECDIQKMVEYFIILFSYTRDYKTDEEKYLKNLKNLYVKEVKEIINAVNSYIENTKDEKNEEKYEKYFPLIKLKELIEEKKINLKDKYVEFIFYYLKQFEDKQAKLDYLLYSKLNELLPEPEEPKEIPQDITLTEEDNKKLNTEPTKQEKFDIILNDEQNKDNNIDNFNILDSSKKENNIDENKTDESATEITIDEYLKQLSDAIEAIKTGLKNENIEFKDFVEDKKKEMNSEGKKIEYISINDLNNKLKNIGVILSDLKLSCLCSKYSLQSDLRLINIKSFEEDLNSK